MNSRARRSGGKTDRLLRLYSQWHETHRPELERRCLTLLGEILAVDPGFKIRSVFQRAF